MKRSLTAAERIIVAADYALKEGEDWRVAEAWLRELCRELRGTGVIIKVNSLLRLMGYQLVLLIHSYGLKVFADLKLNDIDNTLKNDGALLARSRVDMLTVMCSTGRPALRALKETLPDTEILGVTVLTSMDRKECAAIYGNAEVEAVVLGLAMLGEEGGVDGFICSPAEVAVLRTELGENFSYNTPGIRPLWSLVAGDDQNPERIMTPTKAFQAGADRYVIGRPITQHEKPGAAIQLLINENKTALAS